MLIYASMCGDVATFWHCTIRRLLCCAWLLHAKVLWLCQTCPNARQHVQTCTYTCTPNMLGMFSNVAKLNLKMVFVFAIKRSIQQPVSWFSLFFSYPTHIYLSLSFCLLLSLFLTTHLNLFHLPRLHSTIHISLCPALPRSHPTHLTHIHRSSLLPLLLCHLVRCLCTSYIACQKHFIPYLCM